MFAIMRTGGKQYRVQKGDKLTIEKLDVAEKKEITIDDVLMVSDGKSVTVGEPAVKGATVTAMVLAQTRGEKVTIFKKKRRQNYRRKKGHQQDLTLIEITGVKA